MCNTRRRGSVECILLIEVFRPGASAGFGEEGAMHVQEARTIGQRLREIRAR
jgi:hypothetical protein